VAFDERLPAYPALGRAVDRRETKKRTPTRRSGPPETRIANALSWLAAKRANVLWAIPQITSKVPPGPRVTTNPGLAQSSIPP
jgi:hypothetical protein